MLWLTLALAVGGAGAVPPPLSPATAVILDVPYVPQTEALCGAAAAAMVFRYWGDSHADIQPFRSLVDRKAGGIATDALTDAIERRRWRTHASVASIEALRRELAVRHPVIVLLEDRPRRYHYVVVIGADEDGFVVHDPAWGPSRRIAEATFADRWRAARSWSLVVFPASAVVQDAVSAGVIGLADTADPNRGTTTAGSQCDRLLAAAVDDLRADGTADADRVLGRVRAECPQSAGPLRELAGVRFAARRWTEAAALAEEAVARDPHDAYAWEVLASSRFMLGDEAGALRAWNVIGKPRVDDVQIRGLRRTRYALVAESLGLSTGELLTSARLRHARRQLEQLPDQSIARVGYRPEPDGFATVEITLLERATTPIGVAGWATSGARAAIDREVGAAVPGGTGQGELWTASWRWWEARPRAALSFASPRVGPLPGVWRVDASWEAQTYQLDTASPPLREERAHGGVAMTDWLTADVRYEVRAGVDVWTGGRRAASIGGTLERRFLGDRVSIAGDADTWIGSFSAAALRGAFRSSTGSRGFVYRADAAVNAASSSAPLALWTGAGDGHARGPLLRAHSLLRDGVVTGRVFGRRLVHVSGEAQRWIDARLPVRVGAAVFLDAARVSRRQTTASEAFVVDGGVGLRVKAPGVRGALRIDYAIGLADSARALTFGWQY